MITIYKSIYKTSDPHYIDLDCALNRIKNGDQKDVITKIRKGDKSKKQDLPVVLFSGKFKERRDDAILQHSGLIVLDFDHISVTESKKILASDPYVKACWVSPSGDGLKALVEVTNPEKHRDHFRALCEYFDGQYGLEVDSSGSNESRACYESYDPSAVIKENSDKFGKMVFGDSVEQIAIIKVDTDYTKLNLAARMIRMALEGDKHSALLKAAVLMGGYISAGRIEEDEAVRVLRREISKRDIDSIDSAASTIRDGIEKGKAAPISETVHTEDQVRIELLLSDGDMSFMSSDSDDLGWILKYKNGELDVGLTTGNQILDKNFNFKREFVMINGHSSIGKTTFMMYMIVSSAINHDWRWVIYSSENNSASIKMKLLQFACGKTVKELSEREITGMMRWISDHFVIIDNHKTLSYTEILLYAEKIARHRRIDGMLIDPYNSLRIDLSSARGVSVHEYHYEAASEFLTFSQRMNMAVWCNAHSVTASQRLKGNDGMAAAPDAPDTEHGGKWVNRADCFITLHRKIHHPDVDKRRETEFHVRKVRNQETGGEPTPLDLPYVFKMSTNGCSFEMNGPFPRLFNSINTRNVDKQLKINSN